MPYAYTLTAKIPATPEEIYQAWLDSVGHSEMTGSQATMSDEIGAEVSAWDGYISGRNLELVPGERIVQSWRTSEFDDEHGDSVITIVLERADDGTLLTLEHTNVPDEQRGYEEGGWHSNYFEPMIAYFSELREDAVESEPEEMPQPSAPARTAKRAASTAAGRTARKAASTKPPKRPVKSMRRGKRASGAKKSARGSLRAKPAPKRSKSKTKSRAAAAQTKRRAAKTRRGKRR